KRALYLLYPENKAVPSSSRYPKERRKSLFSVALLIPRFTFKRGAFLRIKASSQESSHNNVASGFNFPVAGLITWFAGTLNGLYTNPFGPPITLEACWPAAANDVVE